MVVTVMAGVGSWMTGVGRDADSHHPPPDTHHREQSEQSPMTPALSSRTRDRSSRHTFWIDDRVIDCFAPIMGRYPFGAAALAVYFVLARRADRDCNSWPRLELIARVSGSSERTVQCAIRLLEVLGLVEVTLCYEQGSNRQTSNLYTLLTPPDQLPDIDPDPDKWPPPTRRTLLVRGNRGQVVATTRLQQDAPGGAAFDDPSGVPPRPVLPGLQPVSSLREGDGTGSTPHQAATLPLRHADAHPSSKRHPPGVSLTPLGEGLLTEGTPMKGGSSPRKTNGATFTIEEIVLTNRQVWAAVLGELSRRDDIGHMDLESWLRLAALIGRDGPTLILGAPNAVTRDRIASRLLPAVRDALVTTIGAPVDVSVIMAERG
jgi:hypothetical protein